MHGPTVTILGEGQMGLVTSRLLTESGTAGGVRIWGKFERSVRRLRETRESERLPGFRLPEGVTITTDGVEALDGADALVVAIPAQFVRPVLDEISPNVPEGAPVISVSKGIEVGTLMRVTEVARDVLGERPACVMSGPTIAAELAQRKPASMVAASADAALATGVQSWFSTEYLRIYTSDDETGVEIAGALKNVIAIASGILDGLESGINAKSALLARGLAEITRLGVALGAERETFFGLAGVGDLATTCFSAEGRNRTFGEALGRGESREDILARTNSVVEGVETVKSVVKIAQREGVDMPIVSAVNAVLYEGLGPREAISQLMQREQKEEHIG